MSKRIRDHIRGNVVGYVALFLVLTGGTAQALNGSNTVFSDDIVNQQVKTEDVNSGAVTTSRLAPDAVKTGRVADNNLTGADIADSSLTGNDVQQGSIFGGNIANGTVASQDLQAGAVASAQIGSITRRAESVVVPGGTAQNAAYNTKEQSVSCQSGELALSGEAFWAGQPNEELFISEFIYGHTPAGRPVSLHVTGGNDSGIDRQMNIAVYCLAP
jgi:hypothetical protein